MDDVRAPRVLGRNTEIMEMFVEKYLAAQTRFQRAEEVLSGIAEKIDFAHWALSQNPPKAVFSGGPGLPADAMHSRRQLDWNTWISAADITNAIAEYHDALANVTDTWRAVPVDARRGLKEPRF